MKVLGAGGMGIVLQGGEDPVAVQDCPQGDASDCSASNSDGPAAFLARGPHGCVSSNDDHIVTIYQVGEARGRALPGNAVSEGQSLQARLNRDGSLPVPDACALAGKWRPGDGGGERTGLIHRDIKPGNISLETAGREARDRGRAGGDRDRLIGSRFSISACVCVWFCHLVLFWFCIYFKKKEGGGGDVVSVVVCVGFVLFLICLID